MIKADDINIAFDSQNLFKENINFELNKKEVVLLYGPSGCGKTTLFQIMAHLLKATNGKVFWDDYEAKDMNRSNKIRYKHISIIYSIFNFIETLSVQDNILLPALFAKEKRYKDRLEELIEYFDFKGSNISLKDLLNKDITNLSNGQKEIVAISRALILEEPKYIFADEMLRSFNEEIEKLVWDKFLQYLSKEDKSLFLITHKKHLGESLEDKVMKNCSKEYKAKIFTIKDQILIQENR